MIRALFARLVPFSNEEDSGLSDEAERGKRPEKKPEAPAKTTGKLYDFYEKDRFAKN